MIFNTANAIDYILIAFYFIIIIWVGIFSARKNKNTDEFFKGGGRIPWVLAGFSNWISGFSAFMFVAAAGFTYVNGITAVPIFTSAFWAYVVGYFYFAKRWRRARINSPLQFLTRRFSPSTTYFYSVTAIIPQTVGIGQGLYILCIFVSTALGFSGQIFSWNGFEVTGFQLSILIVGAVMILYTVIGGIWAAVLSDAVQSVIIIVMTVIIFPVSFMYLGQGGGFLAGAVRLWNDAPKGYFAFAGQVASPLFLFCYLMSAMLGYNVAWGQIQRYHSVPDEKGAQKMALLCAVLCLIGPLLWILPVMASRIIFPNITLLWPSFAVPAEASFVSLALLLLPHGMIGFVISAILSATLGHANDTFNWLAITTTRDIYVPVYKRYAGTGPSEKKQMNVARITMLVVGVMGVTVAWYIPRFGGAFNFALEYYSLVAAFSMPVALGMMYRKTPWWSGIASCSAAIIVAITLMTLGVWKEYAFVRNMLSESIVSSVVFFGSAYWFRAEDPRHEELARLDADLRIPVIETDVKFDPAAFKVFQLLGQVCCVLGVVLVLCIAVPGTAIAPASINVVAGAVLLAIGAVLLQYSRKKSKPS
jgi:solute:Na+ symporter, SSS family